ncbi:hypothetical protein [Shewanella sp. 10N.286.52.A9]|uniref:hypothetical protein n=1 Tax=Shewanella sp. 10N.286.52.A9 TaxID=3229711 RepID=UPI003550B886
MDPLSQLFAAYLESVSNNVSKVYSDSLNTTISTKVLQYHDTEIRFQHQMWRIKQDSVCVNLIQDSTQYSKCTQQAKSMFNDICIQLSSKQNLSAKGRSISNMYCNATLTYKPMVAQISQPKAKTPQQLQDKLCNQLILASMQDNSEDIQKQKEAACASVN